MPAEKPPNLHCSEMNSLDLRLTILFQDESLIAIDKPPGLLVHRSRIDTRARQFVLQTLRDQVGQPVYLIHRIDRPTSGVLLFAFDTAVARQVCQQFEQGTTVKEYEAIVRGHPPASGVWNEPLLERHDKMTDRLANSDKPPQAAITEFQTIQSWSFRFQQASIPAAVIRMFEFVH